MVFALILMIKNEERILKRCLEAVENVVDYFCILDTGSTDKSVEIANEFLKTRKGCLTVEPFQNFGHNRTVSFQNAQNYLKTQSVDLTTVYGILLDADMVFVPGTLKQQTLGAIGYKIIQLNGNLEYYNSRIVRMDFIWKCIGVTHEYWAGPTENLEKNICYIDDRNDGGCKQDKFQRDAKLLEDGLEANPTDIRYMFYLAQTYKCIGKFKDAIKMYKKRIAAGGWAEEIWHSHYSIGECYLKLKDIPKFEAWMQKAFMYRSCRTESIYQLAKHFREAANHYKSYHYIKIGQQIGFPKNDCLFIESNVYKGWFDYECSIVEFYIHPEKCLRTTIGYMLKLGDYQQNCLSNLKFSVKPVKSTVIKIDLPKPFGDDFNPSAISVLDYPFANVRYVNYWIENGNYLTKDSVDVQTENAYINLETNVVLKMNDSSIDLPRFETRVKGLEDLRIFKECNQLKFTAISVREYQKDAVRVVYGDYNLDGTYSNYKVIDSPTNSVCEKNWVNIPETDEFIYGWNPLRIGKIRNNKCYFIKQHSVPALFSLFRGSSPPIKWEHDWLVLVHFVEYSSPRKYYHCFVRLTKDYQPISVSLPFCFKSSAIEYCISVVNVDNSLIDCFVSFNDSNPHKVSIAFKELEWINLNGN
jgi:tetratricopeptide (TPR) repeat protein